MNEVIRYIISFLLGTEEESLLQCVSYGESCESQVVIKPSGFFDESVFLTPDSIPSLPLKELDGIPVLFGSNEVFEQDGKIIIGADLIASSFFLLSRYEETVRRSARDEHGRFLGKDSLLGKAGLLMRPLVDEYGKLLRSYLRYSGYEICEPKSGFGKVYLTHDVDSIWTWENPYRALRSTARRLVTRKKDAFLPFLAEVNFRRFDPNYTFPMIIKIDQQFIDSFGEGQANAIYFIMGCEDSRKKQDQNYMAKEKAACAFTDYLREQGARIGYHVSYEAAETPERIRQEMSNILRVSGVMVDCSRNHYLRSREPEDYRELIRSGIHDDFTMGYADTMGFRVGTCRPVRWIDPTRKELTELVLHPLTVMERTVGDAAYMALPLEDAYEIIKQYAQKSFEFGGDIVLLWHNTSFSPEDEKCEYYTVLYKKVLDFLIKIKNSGENNG